MDYGKGRMGCDVFNYVTTCFCCMHHANAMDDLSWLLYTYVKVLTSSYKS